MRGSFIGSENENLRSVAVTVTSRVSGSGSSLAASAVWPRTMMFGIRTSARSSWPCMALPWVALPSASPSSPASAARGCCLNGTTLPTSPVSVAKAGGGSA